jgi:heterodisulfide reductase subunit B
MRLLYFPGCKLEPDLPAYDWATRAVLDALAVQLVDDELNCCGYPVRHQNFAAFLLSAARNLALAEARGLDILTPCKCCFGSFKHALHWLRLKPALGREINQHLAKEGLRWEDRSEVIHLLSLLHRKVGGEALKARVTAPLTGIRVAPHYGCHALRPVAVTGFDNPTAPRIFEDLVTATGATPVPWSRRTECCGNPLREKNLRISLALMERKLASAREAGADYLCSACTYCQLQFDGLRRHHPEADPTLGPDSVAAILYPQLLGLAMGLGPERLGLTPETMPASATAPATAFAAFTARAGR